MHILYIYIYIYIHLVVVYWGLPRFQFPQRFAYKFFSRRRICISHSAQREIKKKKGFTFFSFCSQRLACNSSATATATATETVAKAPKNTFFIKKKKKNPPKTLEKRSFRRCLHCSSARCLFLFFLPLRRWSSALQLRSRANPQKFLRHCGALK